MTLKGRIYRSMYLIVAMVTVIATIIVLFTFYNVFTSEMKTDIKNKAILISESLNYTNINIDYLPSVGKQRDFRITYVAKNGDVLYDNFANIKTLSNHQNRPEIIGAIKNSYADDIRNSDTLGKETYYYAIRLDDYSVLRVAQTTDNIYGVFIKIFPPICLVALIIIILCNYLSIRLTKKIISPLNDLKLDNNVITIYDELAPFVKKIRNQKNEINIQLTAIENRSDTINAITENMKEGLILIDKNGIILSLNKSIMDIFDENNVVGKNILHLYRNIDFVDKAKKALLGEHSELTLKSESKVYTVYFSPTIIDKIVNGAIILFLDITDKSVAETQRKEFSANVSHELKTPLTTILGLSEMIGNDMVNPCDIKEFGAKINAQSSRLLNLINDIIRLSQFDELSITKDFEYFDVSELSRTVADNLSAAAKSKNITIIPPTNNIIMYANRRMIDELISNLIDNGIKYNKDDGNVTINITDDNGIKISVSDTGIGISDEHHSRIFERFYRVDKSRSKRTGDTGLGLAIVKHITEFHNGSVSIKSEVMVGTTIECLFK